MEGQIDKLLLDFLIGLDEILSKFEEFLDSQDINKLKEVTNLLNILGRIHYQVFYEAKHSVLPGSAFEASIMINKKIAEIETRGMTTEDIEYFREIYELFRYIAEKIRTGEYEKGLRDMHKKCIFRED